jgi:broad specificity phosphatase PhoE
MILPELGRHFNGELCLSSLYLVRHGQAGTRNAYDSLSELGRRQSRLLGEYLVVQRVEFHAVYAGGLQRQQQTAAQVVEAFRDANISFPELITDDQWNEFDLAHVYEELAPLLCEADPEFREEYEQMRLEVKQSNDAHEAGVHRHWRPCDTKIVEAWISERFPYRGELWTQFCDRVTSCVNKLRALPRNANILVFTSATPTGILVGRALDVSDRRVRQLAGVLYNSSYTTLRVNGDHLQLFQFNAVPHLGVPELRTHR